MVFYHGFFSALVTKAYRVFPKKISGNQVFDRLKISKFLSRPQLNVFKVPYPTLLPIRLFMTFLKCGSDSLLNAKSPKNFLKWSRVKLNNKSFSLTHLIWSLTMSFPKCKSMIFAAGLVTSIFAMLPAISLAQSTDYRFEDFSLYSFNAGLVGAAIFGISGTFTLNENDFSATISNANLELELISDPLTPQILNFPLASATGVEDLLESDLFFSVNSTPSQTVYQSQFGLSFLPEVFLISVDSNSSNRLATFSGFGTLDPLPIIADGTSFGFSATAVAVPEPTGLSACLLLAIALSARRRRGHLLYANLDSKITTRCKAA